MPYLPEYLAYLEAKKNCPWWKFWAYPKYQPKCCLTEGTNKGGGQNPPPTCVRPNIPVPPQGGTGKSAPPSVRIHIHHHYD